MNVTSGVPLPSMYFSLPQRDLFKYSFIFSLTMSIGSFLFSSIELNEMKVTVGKTMNIFVMFMGISLINILCLKRRDCKEQTEAIKLSKILYVCGFFCSFLFLSSFSYLTEILINKNILPPEIQENHFSQITGWKKIFLLLYGTAIVYAIIALLHNFIILKHHKTASEIALLKLNTANAESANQLLRQQIHPHFLFNALNVLKSLIKKYPQTAEEYLIRLSDFLRASISKNTSGKASVQDEVKLCLDYLEMQKIRFGEALQYNINVEASNYSGAVLPFFSLQPLVENAIKHNGLTEQAPLYIEVFQDGEYIIVRNNLQVKKSVETSTGNGLYGLVERYKILSGEDIVIVDDGKFFSVKLKIIKDAHTHH